MRYFTSIALVLLALASLPALAADRIGHVKVSTGDVTIIRGAESLPAISGAELFEADIIRTGDGSAIGMTFTDNSRLSLGPNSELTLEAYSYEEPGEEAGFDARLSAGTLSAASGEIAKTRPLAMRVLMPTTVLGVRGTEFVVRVSGS
ncbi:MAG: FecR family protein [Pseudomonadota bacterium]